MFIIQTIYIKTLFKHQFLYLITDKPQRVNDPTSPCGAARGVADVDVVEGMKGETAVVRTMGERCP